MRGFVMNYSNKLKERDSSLDIIRIVAFISVISVHFFLNNGFYNQLVTGERMYVMVLIRSFFMDCVPLFIMLTGYLMNKKKLTSSYYYGIIKTIIVYILSSIACLLYASLSAPVTIREAIIKILRFEGAPYSWYIEMYLGLFLIIPFLNIVYHGLTNKKQKQILLITMIVVTSLPNIINIKFKILPTWWNHMYPITYYFIGAYLSEYRPKIKNRYLILLLFVHIFLIGSLNYALSFDNTFIWGAWSDFSSVFNAITTILVFMIIKNISTENWKPGVKSATKYISDLTLSAYLVSWIFDQMFYPILMEKIPKMVLRLEYICIMIIAVTICSLLLSCIVTFLSGVLTRLVKNSLNRLLHCKNENDI